MTVYHSRDALYIEWGYATLIREKNSEGLYDIGLAFDVSGSYGGPKIILLREDMTKEDWCVFKKGGGIEEVFLRAGQTVMEQELYEGSLC